MRQPSRAALVPKRISRTLPLSPSVCMAVPLRRLRCEVPGLPSPIWACPSDGIPRPLTYLPSPSHSPRAPSIRVHASADHAKELGRIRRIQCLSRHRWRTKPAGEVAPSRKMEEGGRRLASLRLVLGIGGRANLRLPIVARCLIHPADSDRRCADYQASGRLCEPHVRPSRATAEYAALGDRGNRSMRCRFPGQIQRPGPASKNRRVTRDPHHHAGHGYSSTPDQRLAAD